MAIPDIDEAIDWQGNPVRCESCAHQTLLAEQRCKLKRSCVHDRYARRIDRFFDNNQALAGDYLTHPHFEVRAIAAKYAPVFRLPALLDDPDETVRWNAVRRLPSRYLLLMREDHHREVRIRVASLLDGDALLPMTHDEDYYVRLVVARRLPVADLHLMIGDKEPEVRRQIASRIDPSFLWLMVLDADPGVRLAVARRLPPDEMVSFMRDPDWRVRYETASRGALHILPNMRQDPDELVRALVESRLATEAPPDEGNVLRFLGRRAGADGKRSSESLR